MGIEQNNNPARQEAIEDAIRMSDWERAPRPGEEFNPTINPDQERVLDGRNDPTHPLVRGRTRLGTVPEIAATTDPLLGQPK